MRKQECHANLVIAHQLDHTFSTDDVYVTINTQRYSAVEKKEGIPNTFKTAMGLPQGVRWKSAYDRDIENLEKNSVYELAPIPAVPAGQSVIGTP